MIEMKDSGIEWIGLIPSHWKICRTKFLCNIVTGNKDTVNRDDEGKYPFFVRSPKVEKINSYSYDGEAILMAGDGVGAGKVFHYFNGKFDFHQRVYNLHCFKNVIGKYFFYYLSENFYREIEKGSAKSTVDSIRLPMILNFPILLPSLDEQKKIVDFLDKKCSAIDSALDAAKKLVEKLREYKKSLITETVTKGLNSSAEMQDSGIEWLGDIPSHWKKSNVFRCINFEGGSQPALAFFIDEPQKGYVRLIQNRDYKTDDYATYVPENMVTKFCDETDVMIGRYGPPIFVIHRGLKGAYNVAMMKATSFILDREFMYYFLQNLALLHYVESFSLRTAGQSGVNPAIFKKYPIFIPPLAEQKKISDFLDKKCTAIDESICQRRKLIEKLTEYKKSLIYEAVTGKVEV